MAEEEEVLAEEEQVEESEELEDEVFEFDGEEVTSSQILEWKKSHDDAKSMQADATKKLADPNVQSAMSDMVDDMGMADMTG